MADQEQDYLDSLHNISKSFEALVQSIKNKIENEKESVKNSTISSKEQTQYFLEFALKLEEISEEVTSTKENTELILYHMRRDSKKTTKKEGLFSKAKDNVSGVFDGIKTIALMAGSIVAMGMAFNIIGEVDFASVVALSIALPLLAYGFAKVKDAKISIKDSLELGVVMTVLSMAIVTSGLALSQMPTLGFSQFLSALGVGIAMGASMIPLAYAANQIGKKGLIGLSVIALNMPLIAAGIMASGLILNKMPTLNPEKFISALGVGVAMGMAMIPLSIAAKLLGETGTTEILKLTLTMPLIAYAIVLSAGLLNKMPELETLNIIEGSFAIASSMIVLSGALWVMDKMGINIKTAALGTLSMVIMSAGLMAMSHILSLGNYSNGSYPSLDWAQGVGLSMLGALPSVLILGALGATGIGFLVIGAGIAGMLMMATGLVGVAAILKGGNFTGGPTKEWAEGVGLSMVYFGNALTYFKPGILSMFTGETMDDNIEALKTIAENMGLMPSLLGPTSNYLGTGPSKEWAEGVGLSLVYFANAMKAFKPGVMDIILGKTFSKNVESLKHIARTMSYLPPLLGPTSNYEGTGPNKEWAEGVGLSMKYFAEAVASFSKGTWGFLSGNKFQENMNGLIQLVSIMPKLPLILGSSSNYEGTGPTKEWAEGVGGSMKHFAEIISTLADDVDPEDVYKWINPLKHIVALMAWIPNRIKNVAFGSYPSTEWTNGITNFMKSFSEFTTNGNDINTTVSNIKLLSDSYLTLANSINKLGNALSNLNEVPDMNNLYGGLVTLSLVDSSNLKKVLEQLKSKDDIYTNMSNKLTSASTSFSSVIPQIVQKTDNVKKQNITNSNKQQTSNNKQKQVSVNPVYRSNQLLNDIYQINKRLEKVLKEISTNTKSSKSSSIGKN